MVCREQVSVQISHSRVVQQGTRKRAKEHGPAAGRADGCSDHGGSALLLGIVLCRCGWSEIPPDRLPKGSEISLLVL